MPSVITLGDLMSTVHDLSKDEQAQEALFYRFLHQLNICSKTKKRLIKKGSNLFFKMELKQDSSVKTEFGTPDRQTITELAVVIEPLVRQASDIYYGAIFELCRQNRESPELTTFIAEATSVAQKISQGTMRLNLNGEDLTPASIYEKFMNKIEKADGRNARKYEYNLSRDPYAHQLLFYEYYNYCMDMVRFMLWIQGVIKKERFLPEGACRDYLCIICRRSGEEAKFTKVEHTLPEALGNTHSMLPRGYCCDECQKLMAPVENRVVNMPLFSIIRLMFVKHTKAGRFPNAKFTQAHYYKRKPNHFEIDSFSGKRMDDFTITNSAKFDHIALGRVKFDHIALGRVLVKAALGAMTLEIGRDYVLNERFDPARKFVQTGKGLHVRLLMQKEGAPDRQMNICWHDLPDGRVGVIMYIYGVHFIFAVTPVPDEEPPPKKIMEKMEVVELWNPRPTPHYRLKEITG
ncbi:MAG: hypothetical protein ACL93V_01555 [Candidatus Electrothrix sp. YB6]